MEKERFLNLTRNYTSLTEEETKNLNALQKEYPYSQVIHNLASRGAQDNQLSSSKNLLSISAVYSTDRSVLKQIITAPRTERASDHPEHKPLAITDHKPVVENNLAVETVQMKSEAVLAIDEALESLHDEALNREIMSDLNKLQQLKHDFEASVEEFEHNRHTKVKGHRPDYGDRPDKSRQLVPKKNNDDVKAINTEILVDKSQSGETLLEELKNKKKVVPESQKQREQIELIDQFIKKQPSIQKNLGNPHEAFDMTEKNFALTEHLVSETLVEILLKQGKKDKAIEVLKKLIWKFPQKKAIFAAQIDELKK